MMNLIYFELFKTYAKWRTYIGFIVIAVLIPLVVWAMKMEGGRIMQFQTKTLQNDFFITGSLFNGWTLSQMIMNSLWIHVPFLITLVAGDQLAGEATAGTFRLILVRPVSRARILNSKYLTTLIYTASLIFAIALLSVGLGLAFLGSGDLLSIDRDMMTIIPESEMWTRFAIAYGLAILSMWVVASLAFLFSSFVENAIGPIIATMAVIVVFLIISNLPVESFEPVKPYLFTTYQNVWEQAFRIPIDWEKIMKSSAVLAAYCAGFWAVTFAVFRRKDILS